MANLLDRIKLKQQTVAVVSLATVLSLSALPSTPAVDTNLIIPGQSIGQTHLGSNGNLYLNKLPAPAAFDASMQQTKRVWVEGSDQQSETLYISTITNAALNAQPLSGNTISHIEVTSPWFHTPDGISTGSTRAQVLRHFPNARSLAFSDGKILSDQASGIAFEFANASADSPCISIAVDVPGDNVRIVGRDRVNALLHTASVAQNTAPVQQTRRGTLLLSDLNNTLLYQSPKLKQEIQQALKSAKKDDVVCSSPIIFLASSDLHHTRVAPFTCDFPGNKFLTIQAKNIAKLPNGRSIALEQLLTRENIPQGTNLQFQLTNWKWWTNAKR